MREVDDANAFESPAHAFLRRDYPPALPHPPPLPCKRERTLSDRGRRRAGSLEGFSRAQIEAALARITEQHYRADVTNEQRLAIQDLGKTYLTLDRLRRDRRDTIWAYVARNLSRPLAYSASRGWAHVVIGNPPWLAFRHMSADLQKRFIALAEAAAEAEKIAARVEIPEGIRFQNARAFVRAALVEARVAPRIDVLVAELLSR